MRYSLGISVLIAGCGGGSAVHDAGARFEGIYQVSAYTVNEQACTEGGSSELAAETFAAVSNQSLAGFDYVYLMSCASNADCRAKLTELDSVGYAQSDFAFTADRVDGDVLIGAGVSTGFGTNAQCTMGSVSASRWTLAGADLRIEKQITLANDYPQDKDGFCTTDGAKAAAAGNACSQFELMTAALVDML